MPSKAECSFKITGWDEETIADLAEGGELKRAHVTKAYTGELEGRGVVEYLMAYKPDGTAVFVGYETVTGMLDQKAGSFVLEHRGAFRDGRVDSTWTVVEDSGAGELAGLKGTATFSAKHQDEYPIVFNYDL